MANPVFEPLRQPSFSWTPAAEFPLEQRTSHAGYDVSRRVGVRKLRSARLQWKALSSAEIDYIESFFDQFNGDNGPFDWKPLNFVRSPTGQDPTLTTVTSGALTGRNPYDVKFSLGGPTDGETLPSKGETILVPDNDVLVVTIPVLPNGVKEWRVYAAEQPNPLTLQATVSGTRTWQEPDTGLVLGIESPTLVNNLSPLITWRLGSGFNPTKFTAHLWTLQLTFLEQHT